MRLSMTIITLGLVLSACAKPDTTGNASASASKEQAKPEVKMYVLDCGHIQIGDMASFARDGFYNGKKGELANPCFLIRHPKGDLLWDAGLSDSLHDKPDGVAMGPFHLSMPKTLKSQLADLGLAPKDIEYFSFSHSHFDHSANANDYAGSTWLVEKAELAFMFSAKARAETEFFSGYNKLENARKIEFSGDRDVFGDGSVRIISTPGHTPGHASLLVNLRHAGPILLSGDLYMNEESRAHRRIPAFDDLDPKQIVPSMDKFEALAASSGARVVVTHDPGDFAKLPIPPKYLD